jgi:hypothetical protein
MAARYLKVYITITFLLAWWSILSALIQELP